MTFSFILRIFQYEVNDVFNWFDDLSDIRLQLCSWIREKVSRQNGTEESSNRRRNINNI